MPFKKILAILIITLVVLLALLYTLMSRANIKNSTTGVSNPVTISPPTPTIFVIDPTIAAIPAQETGGNMDVTLSTTEQAHNDLFFKVPLDMQNYIVDYDYAENKFSILILNDAGEQSYRKWRKDSYPALSDDQFVINDKRI